MKYRMLHIATFGVLGAMLAWNYAYEPNIAWWWFVVVIWVHLSVLFLGCIKIEWRFFMPVLCNGETNEKVVAITFDDGPNATYTGGILDTLGRHNAPAAFYCIGKNIAGNEALLQRIHNEGHLVGNHSYSHHFWFDLFPWKKMLADMQQMDAAAELAAGVRPRLFRPPYGVMNPNLARAIKSGGYTPIGWNIRSLDTTAKDKQTLLLRVTGQLRPGAIILLHDSMAITAEILPQLIENIKAKGYRIVRADELLNVKAYA